MTMLRLATIAVLLSAVAHSHDWYDAYCCDERDCRPATAGEVTHEPGVGYRVRARTGGVIVDEVIPFGDGRIRPSQDAAVHHCIAAGVAGMMSPARPQVRCLYIPTGV